MVGNIGFQELILILLIVSLIFGAKRIPELAKALGQALKEFRKSMKEEDKKEDDEKSSDRKTTGE